MRAVHPYSRVSLNHEGHALSPKVDLPRDVFAGMRDLQSLRLDRNARLADLPCLPAKLEVLHLEGCMALGGTYDTPEALPASVRALAADQDGEGEGAGDDQMLYRYYSRLEQIHFTNSALASRLCDKFKRQVR